MTIWIGEHGLAEITRRQNLFKFYIELGIMECHVCQHPEWEEEEEEGGEDEDLSKHKIV